MTAEGSDPDPQDEPDLVGALVAAVAQLDRRQGELAEENGLLADAVDAIEGYLRARPGGPWSWRDLSADDTATLWAVLYTWVGWLERRYLQYLGQDQFGLRKCWYLHPVVVEHLTALMVSHIAAYRVDKAAPSSALVDWHERCFWPTMQRLKSFFGKCTLDVHVPPPVHPLAIDEVAFQEFVESTTGVRTVLYRPKGEDHK